MSTLFAHSGVDPSRTSTESSSAQNARLDFQSALREILAESGMTRDQLEAMLDEIALRRGDSEGHFGFDEIQEFERLSTERLAHLDTCIYCRELVDCCCDKEYVQQLVRYAVRPSSATEAPRSARPIFGLWAQAGAMVFLLLLVFPIGKLYSSYETRKTLQDLYRSELSSLRLIDSGDDFKAARLYAELNLPDLARTSFFKALRDESVPHSQIVKLQNLTLDAERANWLQRTTAKTQVALLNHWSASRPKSAEDYLHAADLQLTAGKPTAAYIYMLYYLESVDAKPAAAKEFIEAPLAMSAASSIER